MADVQTFKGTFTTPTATGNDTVSGIGFTPKAVLFWGVPVTSESIAVHAASWTGMTDGTNDKVIMTASEDGVADTRRDINESACLSILNADSDTPVAVATLSSFNSDGFVLNYSSTTTDYVVHFVAFGGDDVTAIVGQVAASASPVSGLSVRPKLTFVMSAGLALGGAASQHSINATIGCFDDEATPNEWWLATYMGQDDSTNKDSIIRTSGFTGQLFTGAVTWEASITSVNNDGFAWAGTNADGFYYMVLNFNGEADTIVGNFTKSTSAAPASQDLPDMVWTPQIYGLATGSKTVETLTAEGCAASVGAYDGTNQGLTLRTDPDAATNADQRQNNDNVLANSASNAVFDSLATAQAITDSTPTIVWDPNDATADIIGYWAIEFIAPPVTFDLDGYTRNFDGDPLGNSECFLFKHDGYQTLTFVAHDQSNSDGYYQFAGVADNDGYYLVSSWKNESPHVFDVTDHVLQPIQDNPEFPSHNLYLRSDVDKEETSVDNDLRLRTHDDDKTAVPDMGSNM